MPPYELDPALQAYLAACADFEPGSHDLIAQRECFARSCLHFTGEAGGVLREDDRVGQVPVRLYRPEGKPPDGGWPVVLYLHGGGWSLGDHTTHDWFAFAVMRRVPVAMVAVAYRLAPEHPFPAPLDDAMAVWEAISAGRWSEMSTVRLAVAGDSAGGTLAAGLCMALRKLGRPQPRLQALVYPILTAHRKLESMSRHAGAPSLSAADVHAAINGYAPTVRELTDATAFPLDADNHGQIAPAFIGIAEFDPLSDHGKAYADVLQSAQIPVRLFMGEGLVHGALRATGVREVERFYDALTRALALAFRVETVECSDAPDTQV